MAFGYGGMLLPGPPRRLANLLVGALVCVGTPAMAQGLFDANASLNSA
jgi:hypothetical protein